MATDEVVKTWRDVLIGKLLYLMQYPVSGLAVALEQIRKQKEGAA